MPKKSKQVYGSRSFDMLDDNQAKLMFAKAGAFIAKQGWSYDEFDRDELVFCTAVYLHHVEFLLTRDRVFPCYAVHCFDDDSRFESGSHSIAFEHFKRLNADGKRAAVFYWADRHTQKRVYVHSDYPYDKDFGPKVETV